MANLKTDYKDDVLDTSVNEKRKYRLIQNDDGTVSFEDVTEYLQEGDSYGAVAINEQNTKINEIDSSLNIDFSNASENVQDVNTLLQKLLDRFYPAIEPYKLIPVLSSNTSSSLGTASGTTTWDDASSHWKAFDENLETAFQSKARQNGTTVTPVYVQFEFNEPVRIYSWTATFKQWTDALHNWNILYKDKNGNWDNELDDVSIPKGASYPVTFNRNAQSPENVEVYGVRLNLKSHESVSDGHFGMVPEFQVYGVRLSDLS